MFQVVDVVLTSNIPAERHSVYCPQTLAAAVCCSQKDAVFLHLFKPVALQAAGWQDVAIGQPNQFLYEYGSLFNLIVSSVLTTVLLFSSLLRE